MNHAPLGPHGLVGVEQSSVAVEAVEESSVLGVHGPRKPERQRVREQSVAIGRQQGLRPVLPFIRNLVNGFILAQAKPASSILMRCVEVEVAMA